MVIAGVALDESTLGFLKEIGVKDSKKLSRKKREELFDVILETSSGFSVVKVEPEQIDRENLNSLTYRAVNKIISSLIYLNPTKVTVDKVGQESEVINYLNSLGITSNVVHEADVNFVECSAASVVAKVIRDRAIDEIKRTYGDIGSGYPSDERTVTWVSEIHRSNEPPPPFLRRSWKILKRIAPTYYVEKRGVLNW
ncbi:Ribonuclease HII [Sulfuracidifex tepidarius]|uniref:Ribonuclease n=2 Tax=Sulfuracidifex tepidarius TaxID=1294262 RepID=A0A510DZ18_9CREN|nr:Ribonuclease HII [Sulfuracidifex tepidarius]BBG28221.1 Ribonuclease HII [Sulfuracidifex tepidarius]